MDISKDRATYAKDGEESTKNFKRLFFNSTSSFFKYERIQDYSAPEDEAYLAFLSGDIEKANELMVYQIGQQEKMYQHATESNIIMTRVRYVEFPLADYLQYELHSYKVSTTFGERIFVIQEETNNKDFKETTDFVIFDQKDLLILDYDERGVFLGHWHTNYLPDVEKFSGLAANMIKSSMPLGTFHKRLASD